MIQLERFSIFFNFNLFNLYSKGLGQSLARQRAAAFGGPASRCQSRPLARWVRAPGPASAAPGPPPGGGRPRPLWNLNSFKFTLIQ